MSSDTYRALREFHAAMDAKYGRERALRDRLTITELHQLFFLELARAAALRGE